MKSWLQDNNIGIYSTHNEGKPAVVEQFIQGKAYKYLNSVLKNVNIIMQIIERLK